MLVTVTQYQSSKKSRKMKMEEQDPEVGKKLQWETELFQQKAIILWRQKEMFFGTTVVMLQRRLKISPSI